MGAKVLLFAEYCKKKVCECKILAQIICMCTIFVVILQTKIKLQDHENTILRRSTGGNWQ